MLHDVREAVAYAVGPQIPVAFFGRMGGVIPTPDEVAGEIRTWLTYKMGIEEYLPPEDLHGPQYLYSHFTWLTTSM